MNVPATSITDIEPPSHNEKMRETIKQVVGQLAADVVTNLNSLRKQIDDLEKLVMINAERVSSSLTEHANICGEVQQEIARLNGVVASIRATQVEASQLNGVQHEQRN
jgi:hypothetical protein